MQWASIPDCPRCFCILWLLTSLAEGEASPCRKGTPRVSIALSQLILPNMHPVFDSLWTEPYFIHPASSFL